MIRLSFSLKTKQGPENPVHGETSLFVTSSYDNPLPETSSWMSKLKRRKIHHADGLLEPFWVYQHNSDTMLYGTDETPCLVGIE